MGLSRFAAGIPKSGLDLAAKVRIGNAEGAERVPPKTGVRPARRGYCAMLVAASPG
jgi:hypothetical protein